MSVLEAIGLGLLQGATEFLPVSSSGHLTLAERALGMEMDAQALAIDVMLHAATLAAVLVYFGRAWTRRLRGDPRLLALGFVACVPVALAYFAARRAVEWAKGSLVAVAAAFILAGGFLVFASLFTARRASGGAGREDDRDPAGREDVGRLAAGGGKGFLQAALVGLGQAVALLPGVSRSGVTIGAGMLAGIDREAAFEFSFLVGAPVMLAAVALEATEIGVIIGRSPAAALAGFAAAFGAGTGALVLLRKVLARRKLWAFGAYTMVLGVLCLVATGVEH